MKLLKFTLVLFIFATIVSCGSDDEPTLTLSNSSLAGTYNVTSFDSQIVNLATVMGITATVSTTTVKGDTFQTELKLNADGTYTALGQLRIVSTTTAAGSNTPTEDSSIVNIDESGTYVINTTDQTIKITPANSANFNLIDGTLDVVLFNETMLNVKRETSNTVGAITINEETSISFVRQ